MAMSFKADHRILGRKEVLLQTLPSELSWFISKCNGISFLKYVKMFFSEPITAKATKRLNFDGRYNEKLHKLTSSAHKNRRPQQKTIIIP